MSLNDRKMKQDYRRADKVQKKAKTSDRANDVSLADRAYSTIRDAINSGELTPGERVSEYQVAAWLKISRTPAREALRRLEGQGLLSHIPRRGLVVVTIDDEALLELYHAREVVESALARLAAVNGSGPEIKAILRLTEIEPSLLDDVDRLYAHNRDFHNLIWRAAHNRYLAKTCNALHEVITLDRRGSNLAHDQRRTAIIQEHRAIATAIAARRASEAAEAAVRHIRNAYEARFGVAFPSHD